MHILGQDGKIEQFKVVEKVGPTPRNERDDVMNQIFTHLQADYKPFYIKDKKKIKVSPWTLKRLAIKLSYLKSTKDLYYLLSVCKQANNFTAMFNYLTKMKKKS